MKEQKRVKLTHGSARVDLNCSEETIMALDEMTKLAFDQLIEEKSSPHLTVCEKGVNFSVPNFKKMSWWERLFLEY